LQSLIAIALENNRDLRIAAARVQEARAQYGLASAERWPTLNVLGTTAFSALPGDLSGTGSAVATERHDLSVSMISYEVDFWGRLQGGAEAARLNLLSTGESQRMVRISLIADVANAYYTYLQARELERLAALIVVSRRSALALVSEGRAIGGAYDLEHQTAMAQLESSQMEQDAVAQQKAQALNRLNYLLGKPLRGSLEDASLDEQGFEISLAPGLPSEVLLQRPDVLAAEKRLMASHANVAAARAAFLPKVVLTAGAGVASAGLASLFNGTFWMFQPSLTLPLFDGGRLASGVDLAEARKVISIADYEKTIQLAFREVSDLLSARESLARQYRSTVGHARAQLRLLEVAQARVDVGLLSPVDLLEAKRALYVSRQMVTQVRRAQLESATQLYKALGGGDA
jgi:multidrug efflux system outer membrane protein